VVSSPKICCSAASMSALPSVRSLVVGSLVVLCVGAMGLATAQAQDPRSDQAREHFARGQTAYNQGDYEAAIREWNSAYELDARPRIQFNLAQAYERLGRLTEALTALDNYIEAADPNDAQ